MPDRDGWSLRRVVHGVREQGPQGLPLGHGDAAKTSAFWAKVGVGTITFRAKNQAVNPIFGVEIAVQT